MHLPRRVVRWTGVALAVAAGVTVMASAGQAAPIACGSVVTRSVVLTRDLIGCQGDGLVMGASGITVDLAGHTVAGLVSDGSVGIRNPGKARVVVRNGVVRSFERGVQLTGATGNRLRDLTVELNGSDGIDHDDANGNRVTGMIGNGNGSAAEPLTGQILLTRSDRNRLDGNDISASSTVGIVLVDADHNRLDHNQVGFVGSDGNIGGIFLLAGSDRTLLLGNVVANNRPGDGVLVEAGSRRTVVAGTLASGNGDDGIQADDPGTRLVGNTANDNGDLGVEAVAGVTGARGNRAAGNANPAQCVNLRCAGEVG